MFDKPKKRKYLNHLPTIFDSECRCCKNRFNCMSERTVRCEKFEMDEEAYEEQLKFKFEK